MRTLLIAALALSACSKNKGETESRTPPALDTSCTADDQCVPAPGCCPAPCTGDVINREDLDRARAQLEDRCDPSQECPVAGACQEHLYVCESGTCQITYAGEAAFERRKTGAP